MSSPLERAIAALEIEVSLLTDQASKTPTGGIVDGTTDWWMLRAKTTGLSLLRTFLAQGLTDPKEADDFRKNVRALLTKADPVVKAADPFPDQPAAQEALTS